MSDFQIRLEVARNILDMSSARLQDMIFSGSKEALESAAVTLRIARTAFLLASAEFHDSFPQTA